MKMKIGLLLFLVGALCSPSTGQLVADINMAGVKGMAQGSMVSGRLSISVSLTTGQSFFVGQSTTLELRPAWVYYDTEVADRCSDEQLGQANPAMTLILNSGFTSVSNAEATATFQMSQVLDMVPVEGMSIKLSTTSKTVCATIQKEGEYHTAVATFRGPTIFGAMYFRQHQDSDGMPTRIVTALQSTANSAPASWKILKPSQTCSTAFSTDSSYNPFNADNSQCNTGDLSTCAVGGLSSKFGNLGLGLSVSRLGFTDTNLPLSGSGSVVGQSVAINTGEATSECAEIMLYTTRSAKAVFSEDGVTGMMTFTQRSPFDPSSTHIDITGLQSQAKGYHVHKFPRPVKIMPGDAPCAPMYVSGHLNPYDLDVNAASYPAPTAGSDDEYEIGDLSAKYGTMAGKNDLSNNVTDWNLPLFGKNSIVGRSVVIHRDDATASRWICTNIEPMGQVVAAVATFKYPVIGQVIFVQAKDEPHSDVSIFARLEHLYDAQAGSNAWQINTNMVDADMMSDIPDRCLSTNPIFNPSGLYAVTEQSVYEARCSANKVECKAGDMSRKLGALRIRATQEDVKDNYAENFFTDDNLHLSGDHSIIGKSVAIMDSTGNNILACADIIPLHAPKLQATISSEAINGKVTFTQMPGYGARTTRVTNNLRGTSPNHRLSIYELPPSSTGSPCSNIGNKYNPLMATAPASGGTESEYPVGDLRMFGMDQAWSSQNLPLSGITSIMGRSLAVLDAGGQVVECAQVMPATDNSLPQLAVVNITAGKVRGSAVMIQEVRSDGSMSDTAIILDFRNNDGTTSENHNWHVHKDPIGNDSIASTGRCMSAKGHFDPYNAIANKNIYDRLCGKPMPLHCEVGDQAKKLGTYTIQGTAGQGRAVYNDVDLPLAGKYSVLGRSLVFHVANRGAPRQACADIIPASADPIYVEFTTPADFDKRTAAEVYANAAGVGAPVGEVVVEVISQTAGITKANIHFGGFQRELYRARFLSFVSDEDNRESLGQYAPTKTGSGSGADIVIQASILKLLPLLFIIKYLLSH